MSHLEAVDISQWQGAYKDYGTPILIIKVSGGDNGLYCDSQANNNYTQAVNQGKAVGMYHFAGGKDPIVESNYFIRACSPLEENDVMVLDWEVSHPDPVGWCKIFMDNVHNQTGVWPLLYINLSTLRAHDWSPVLKNCGLWLAAWNGNPEADINTGGIPYVMQQYQGSPLDRDAWFGSLDQFKAYGYHAATPPPTTTSTTTTTTTTTTATTTATTTTTLPPNLDQENNSLLKQILALLQGLVDKFNSIFK